MEKFTDVVKEIKKTKKSSIKILFANNKICYVLERNKNLYQIGTTLRTGMEVSVCVRRQWARLFCTKLFITGNH